nr:transcription factor DIVARICATA-like isoform X2 [Ipomoea batatas]
MTVTESSSSVWSRELDKAFENALATYPEDLSDRWEKIAADVPGKSLKEVKLHYEILMDDVSRIESGCVPLPYYDSSSDSLTSHDDKKGGNSGQGNNDSHHGKSTRSDQERRKGIAWTEEEHRATSPTRRVHFSVSRIKLDAREEIEISAPYQEYPWKRNFYKPSLVSIGPKYSKEVDQVKDKEYKNMYMKSFLERATEQPEEEEEYREYFRNEMKLLDKARNYYKEIGITYPHNDEELVEMLVLDGCFVVEFVLKCKEGGNGDPRNSVDGKKAREDMVLFENLLPFEVLSAIYKKVIGHTKEVPSFIRLVKFAFASLTPKFSINNFYDDNKPQKPMDLLHVVYSLCLPRNVQALISQAAKGNEENMWLRLNHMNSATELKEVGISFEKIGQVFNMPKKYEKIPTLKYPGGTSLFDISFCNGVMTIPSFKVDNFTELFFRNMIAMEQRCDTLNPKYFTDYARLMDHLLDTTRDVSLLRKNGVIQNLLGEDRKVAYIFNNLSVEVDSSTNFYFAGVYRAVDEHSRNNWSCLSGACCLSGTGNYYCVWKVISTLLITVSLLILVFRLSNGSKTDYKSPPPPYPNS